MCPAARRPATLQTPTYNTHRPLEKHSIDNLQLFTHALEILPDNLANSNQNTPTSHTSIQLNSTIWSQRFSSGVASVGHDKQLWNIAYQVTNTLKASPSDYGSSVSKCVLFSTKHLSGPTPSTPQLEVASASGCRESTPVK